MTDLLLLFDGFKMNLGEGAFYSLLGLAMVFVGIAILVFILWALGKIISSVGGNPKKSKEEKKKSDAASSAPAPAAPASPVVTDGVSAETVAAITAAIAAYMQTEGTRTSCDFVVRRIKKL